MAKAKWTARAIGVCVLLGILTVSLHLNDAVWQDEAYSLINFSMRGWLYPFTDYHLPNNHILLSSFMSYWWSPNDALWHLRLPLFLSFIIGIVVLSYVTSKQFGMVAALSTVLFYSLSPITSHFALQLRGYGLSWLFVILLVWATFNFIKYGRVLAAWVYLLSSAALVALIPTNVIVCMVFIIWGGVLLFDDVLTKSIRIRRFLFIALVPLLGGVAYLGVLPELLLNSKRAFSDWGRLEVYGELMKNLAVEFWIFLPMMVIGAWALWTQCKREHRYSHIGLLLAVTLVPPVVLFGFKHALFPRSLVPLLPLLCVVGGILVAQGSRLLGVNSDSKATTLIFGLTTIVILTRLAGGDCNTVSDPWRSGNLCRHYYHADYKPQPIIEVLRLHQGDGRPVITSYESGYALAFININYGLGLNLLVYRQFQQGSTHLAPWIVIGRDDKLSVIQSVIPKVKYAQVLDSGYFQLYRPVGAVLPTER